MKRLFSILTTSLMVSCSMVGPVSSASPAYISSEAAVGIITPDVAVDGMRTSRIGRTTAGETVLCPETMQYSYNNASCLDTNGRSAFVWPYQMVPVGRKYVGFRIVSQGSSVYYEVYWK